MRLPRGYIALRVDLGDILRAARRGDAGRDFGHKQETLAALVGISRITLSRIERGRATPRMDTLNRLMAAFDLKTVDVAVRGQGATPALLAADTIRADKEADLGAALRDWRRELGLSLAVVVAAAGVSASQLSRIERGQSRYSRWFAWHPDDTHLHEDDRRRVFVNPVLDSLRRGRWDSDPGGPPGKRS